MSWISVLKASELATGQARAVEVGGQPIILLRVSADRACAVECCAGHDEEPSGEAALDDEIREEPRRGAPLEFQAGALLPLPLPLPATLPLEVFPARITTDGWIEVDPEGSP